MVPEDLSNESDVEQKFLYPFLINLRPKGLGIPKICVKTKPSIKKLHIGKGGEAKFYFPDYIVSKSGVPLFVVEAKAPTEDPRTGFREARMYAHELNSMWDSAVNPVQRVLATNGLIILIGHPDQSEPFFEVSVENLEPYSVELERIVTAQGVGSA